MYSKTEIVKQEFHDACGIGFIAELSGKPGRRVIELSIEALKNMSHRGASGSDEKTSDGTGLLTDIPYEYFRIVLEEELDKKIGKESLGIAMVFTAENELPLIENKFSEISTELGIKYLGIRQVPTNSAVLGEIGKATCPMIVQLFFSGIDQEKYSFETRLFIVRKSVEQIIYKSGLESFICSLSSKTERK